MNKWLTMTGLKYLIINICIYIYIYIALLTVFVFASFLGRFLNVPSVCQGKTWRNVRKTNVSIKIFKNH